MEHKNEPKRCGFYVKRKRRCCKMLPAKGNTYCAEHLCFQSDQKGYKSVRVKCPLDPSHTVFKDRLEKHLQKCNSRKKTQEKYYEKNINSGLADYQFSQNETTTLNAVLKPELYDLIQRVQDCYSKHKIEPDTCIGSHNALASELKKEEYGPTTRKHLIQQASLINIIESSKAFRANTAFVEFGAGKGKLSHWLQKAVGDSVENVDYVLIDRQNHRNKFDCYHKGDDQGPTFKRLYVDIEHLNLSKVDELKEKGIVAFGKHLCGAATDLSLRCLTETQLNNAEHIHAEKKQKLELSESFDHGDNSVFILFALCCFHRCSWPSYVGKEFFINNGLNAVDFHRMKMMCSWATCGFRYHEDRVTTGECDSESNPAVENNHLKLIDVESHADLDKQSEQDSDTHSKYEQHSNEPVDWINNSNNIKLSSEEKKAIGLQCKRLIDIGRVKYLEKHGFTAKLMYYVNSDVTLEDIVLFAQKKHF
eukprot:gene9884-10894_t